MSLKDYSTAENEEMGNTDELERDVGVSATNLREEFPICPLCLRTVLHNSSLLENS